VTWPFGNLKMFGYDVLAIDPPTRFELRNEATGAKKGAAAQYDLMTWEEIAALPIGHLARPNALLLLWACAPTLRKSMALLDAWGATYITEIVWRKVTVNGKVRMGPGYRGRTMHEPILMASFAKEFQDHAPFPSIFDGVARQHSRKPEEFYALVEKVYPHAWRADIFSRQRRPGWDNWGNEATKFNNEESSDEASADRNGAPDHGR
jgi:N6-adenosine-specific RNA methylase IME4